MPDALKPSYADTKNLIALQQVTNAVLWVAEEYEHEEAGKPVAAQSSVEPAV